jgi:hypothetical protein
MKMQCCEHGPKSCSHNTYESAQQARLLHNTELERLASDKHSNLFGLFVSYDENEIIVNTAHRLPGI